MKWKKVFIEKSAWSEEVMMYLTSLQLKRNKGVLFTTQFFTLDGVTLTWMALALILGVVLGAKLS
jgi:hypothetical protein